MEGYIAQILFFAGNFAPRFWAFCDGQIININSNTALFSLLGFTYGGNGQTTFALPDFRGRVPIGVGQGPGLSETSLGESSGAPTATLVVPQMPAHSHAATVSVAAASSNGSSATPVGNVFATSSALAYGTGTNVAALGTTLTLGPAGGDQAFTVQQPTLAVCFIICLSGYYPSRP